MIGPEEFLIAKASVSWWRMGGIGNQGLFLPKPGATAYCQLSGMNSTRRFKGGADFSDSIG
jgi:hypothetical protein